MEQICALDLLHCILVSTAGALLEWLPFFVLISGCHKNHVNDNIETRG